MKIIPITSIPLILSVVSCATIFTGPNQTMVFESSPSGAKVIFDGAMIGETPLTKSVPKKTEKTVVFSKDGYKDLVIPLITSVEPAFFGNIILGGLPGTTTDIASGSINKYEPGLISVQLQPN